MYIEIAASQDLYSKIAHKLGHIGAAYMVLVGSR
jgi:hypothetical protein